MAHYKQGMFKPHNPSKYLGNPKNIKYRSQWEFTYMMKLDHDVNIIEWGSEEISIPYLSPIDKRVHRYFPDFYVKKKTVTGFERVIIEIKPLAQTKPPKKGKSSRKFLKESMTYAINIAKWEAAERFCAQNGMSFVKLTEKELNIAT